MDEYAQKMMTTCSAARAAEFCATTTARRRADRAHQALLSCKKSAQSSPGNEPTWRSMPMMPAREFATTGAMQTHNATAAFS